VLVHLQPAKHPSPSAAAQQPNQKTKNSKNKVVGCSVDSHFSHLAWVNTPRNKGGLGGTGYPLLADLTKSVAKDYEVLIEDGADAGVALRCVGAADGGG
jgi:peroxiredoxin (alkyl hydroperoxide reductase subunit C)